MIEIIITKNSNSASNCYDDPIPVCHIEGRCLQKARIYRQDQQYYMALMPQQARSHTRIYIQLYTKIFFFFFFSFAFIHYYNIILIFINDLFKSNTKINFSILK